MNHEVLPEEALVLRHGGNLTSLQKEELTKLALSSHHKTEYISNWLQSIDLPIEDAMYAMEVAQKEGIDIGKMKEFINEGYSLSQFVDIVDGKRSIEGEISFRYSEESEGFRVNKSASISYNNMKFIDEQTGDTHDAQVITDKILEITDFVLKEDTPKGVSEVIYGIKSIIEESKGAIGFNEALFRSTNVIPEPFSYE